MPDLPEAAIPTVGLHEDISAGEYHAWYGASQSRLKTLRDRTPAHLLHEIRNPAPQTPALAFGEMVHDAVLLPDLFRDRYVSAGQCEATKKGGDRCSNTGSVRIDGHWFCGVRGHAPDGAPDTGYRVVDRSEWLQAKAMWESVRGHPVAGALLNGPAEMSAAWTDEETGVLCKARFDITPAGIGAIGDLKTTRDASPAQFTRAIYNYGYYMQAAHYLRGARQLGIEARHFVIIAVEKDPPYAVAVYRIRDDAVYAGEEELRPLLKRWAECEAAGEWPGYPEEAVDISLPPWSWRQIDERVQEG